MTAGGKHRVQGRARGRERRERCGTQHAKNRPPGSADLNFNNFLLSVDPVMLPSSIHHRVNSRYVRSPLYFASTLYTHGIWILVPSYVSGASAPRYSYTLSVVVRDVSSMGLYTFRPHRHQRLVQRLRDLL